MWMYIGEEKWSQWDEKGTRGMKGLGCAPPTEHETSGCPRLPCQIKKMVTILDGVSILCVFQISLLRAFPVTEEENAQMTEPRGNL